MGSKRNKTAQSSVAMLIVNWILVAVKEFLIAVVCDREVSNPFVTKKPYIKSLLTKIPTINLQLKHIFLLGLKTCKTEKISYLRSLRSMSWRMNQIPFLLSCLIAFNKIAIWLDARKLGWEILRPFQNSSRKSKLRRQKDRMI